MKKNTRRTVNKVQAKKAPAKKASTEIDEVVDEVYKIADSVEKLTKKEKDKKLDFLEEGAKKNIDHLSNQPTGDCDSKNQQEIIHFTSKHGETELRIPTMGLMHSLDEEARSLGIDPSNCDQPLILAMIEKSVIKAQLIRKKKNRAGDSDFNDDEQDEFTLKLLNHEDYSVEKNFVHDNPLHGDHPWSPFTRLLSTIPFAFRREAFGLIWSGIWYFGKIPVDGGGQDQPSSAWRPAGLPRPVRCPEAAPEGTHFQLCWKDGDYWDWNSPYCHKSANPDHAQYLEVIHRINIHTAFKSTPASRLYKHLNVLLNQSEWNHDDFGNTPYSILERMHPLLSEQLAHGKPRDQITVLTKLLKISSSLKNINAKVDPFRAQFLAHASQELKHASQELPLAIIAIFYDAVFALNDCILNQKSAIKSDVTSNFNKMNEWMEIIAHACFRHGWDQAPEVLYEKIGIKKNTFNPIKKGKTTDYYLISKLRGDDSLPKIHGENITAGHFRQLLKMIKDNPTEYFLAESKMPSHKLLDQSAQPAKRGRPSK